MDLLSFALLLSGCLYCCSVMWLWCGLGRAKPDRVEECSLERPSVSVVVAARDEQELLPDCLQALSEQDYQGDYEVVVVNDRSRDNTWQILVEKAALWPQLKPVQAAGELRYRCPKKSALAQGIEVSSGTILLFTDADCRPPSDWLESMVAHFAPEVGLVAGYARPDPVNGWAAQLLAVDNIAVGALGAGSIAMGRPLSCTGRNLAYRRQVYDQVGGFAEIGHLIGGDDVYFMRLVAAGGAWRMVFNREAEILSSPPQIKVGEVVQQKLRHAAKGGHYKGGAFLLAAGIYVFHFILAWALLRTVWTPEWNVWLWGVWSVRWLADLMLLARMSGAAERKLLWSLPAMEVVYIPYVLIFTVVGRLGWFRWKP